MASLEPVETKNGITICGYIRENFDKKCWIQEIMEIIIQFYANKGGSLYVFGSGKNGSLGIKEYENKICKVPTVCLPFDSNNAMCVAAGEIHTLILDIDNKVWCCGHGGFGQLGNGQTNDLNVPKKLNLKSNIISICAGDWHSLFLCDNGWVHSCGNNENGQLGHGDFNALLIPTIIEKLKMFKVIQISAGADHSAALTEDGELFCFGENEDGECGVGEEKGDKIAVPTQIQMNDKIIFVECGGCHSMIITMNHLVYSYGYGKYGALGHGDLKNRYIPALIKALENVKIKTCAAGNSFSLCVDEEGTVWAFGENDYGECGFSSDVKKQLLPKEIGWFAANNIKAVKCAAGTNHSSVIAEDGIIYVFGSNHYCQLGLESDQVYFTPKKLPLAQNVRSVSFGCGHTAVICSAN